MDNDGLRLQAYLAQAGVDSRRKCEDIVKSGRVEVNGRVVLAPGERIGEEDEVRLDGRLVKPMRRKIYIALNKPSGYISSNKDDRDRPVARDLIANVPQRIYNVGRLDYMTSGLLFFTNDGDFAQLISHPSTHLEKEYVVTTKKVIPEELMKQFLAGIRVNGEFYKAKSYRMKGPHTVHLVLEEGRNQELRKVFLSRSITVKKIHRVRIGSVTVKGLQPGHYRNLKESEVDRLRDLARAKGKRKDGERGKS
jgi:23S rRNA pseudouridine2605 synthase